MHFFIESTEVPTLFIYLVFDFVYTYSNIYIPIRHKRIRHELLNGLRPSFRYRLWCSS